MLRFLTTFLVAIFVAGSGCLAQTSKSTSLPVGLKSPTQATSAEKSDREATPPTQFDVAVIRQTDPRQQGWRAEFTPHGFTAMGVTCRDLIHEAYGIYEENRLSGGPAWIGTQKFDVEAKFDASGNSRYKDLSLDERRVMLRHLLAERFGLQLHVESKDFDAFALVPGKSGPKVHETAVPGEISGSIRGINGLVKVSQPGHLEIENMSMGGFAQVLLYPAGRIVVDETGLTGRYDLVLQWTPDNTPSSSAAAGWPTLVTALQEQLGLRLQLKKVPMETLVVDRIEMPAKD